MDWLGLCVGSGSVVVGSLVLKGLSSIGLRLTAMALARQKQHAENLLRFEKFGESLGKLERAAELGSQAHQDTRREIEQARADISIVRQRMEQLTRRVEALELRTSNNKRSK